MESRARTFLSVYTFGVLGLLLLVAPWSGIWEQAATALLPARWSAWARSGWVRGLVSGLGVLDLLVAAHSGRDLWRGLRAGRGAGRVES